MTSLVLPVPSRMALLISSIPSKIWLGRARRRMPKLANSLITEVPVMWLLAFPAISQKVAATFSSLQGVLAIISRAKISMVARVLTYSSITLTVPLSST